jgi:hypothetical protein
MPLRPLFRDVVLSVRGVVVEVRKKFVDIIRNVEGDPGTLTANSTCKNATDVTVPPCLHAIPRVPRVLREFLFPLNFPILVRWCHSIDCRWVGASLVPCLIAPVPTLCVRVCST